MLVFVTSMLCADQMKKDTIQLLEAPTELNVSGMSISFEPYAYLNLMPRVIGSPKREIDCAKEGRFLVKILFNRSSLPKDTSIEKVWVHTGGGWWSGSFNAAETRRESANLVMIARDCPPQNFRPGVLVDVVLEVKDKQITKYLRSPPTKLGAAH
jgi:hypothetical protein